MTRVIRDEQWPVSTVDQTVGGELLTARGVSELVEGTTAQDLLRTTVVADTNSHYVWSRLWLEFTLRKTSLPISDDRLVTTLQSLATPLSSQREAVTKALQPDQLRTRLLIADVVGLGATGCIVHSDRGSHFRARKFVHALNRHGLVGSMGKVGAAGDNAAMESFFALLQKNVLARRFWASRDELRIAIVTWTERTYHRRRRQVRLGRLTPIEYETMMNLAVTLAA